MTSLWPIPERVDCLQCGWRTAELDCYRPEFTTQPWPWIRKHTFPATFVYRCENCHAVCSFTREALEREYRDSEAR